MREIKFRAWDKVNKVLRDVEELIISKNNAIVAIRDSNGTIYQVHEGQIVLIQYTGLKDKNGKEIYEGDILFTSWQHDGATNYDYEICGEVKWDSFRYKWSIEHVNKNNELIIYPFYSFEREELDTDSIEVIGNIYENPELLENLNK